MRIDKLLCFLRFAKTRAIAQNPQVALLFPWLLLNRQVRVEGTAVALSKAAALRYFLSRPRGSQLGAWLTQSEEALSSRALLHARLAALKRRFQAGEVPLPPGWGGFRVIPHRYEFWQGRPSRLHDRLVYRRDDPEAQTWHIERLAP